MEIDQQKVLSDLGIDKLNEMQLDAEKTILKEKEIMLVSPTGSGKTLAYLMPALKMMQPDLKGVQCLILVPTRELVLQIEQVWKKMKTGFKVNACYGGHDMGTEINNMTVPPALLIGTPGRVADHLTRRSVSLDSVHMLILDEFDKSLEFGFQEQMSYIIKASKNIRKRVLVSATAGIQVPEFTGVTFPKVLNYGKDDDSKSMLTIELVKAADKDKIETLFQLLCSLPADAALIFCNHRDAVERTAALLNERGIYATCYHGGMEQEDRERALIQFRNKSVNYLVTTDLAARGLDIPEMKYVIHYHLPQQAHEFIHRNGRTARMHASGKAYVILHDEEERPRYLDHDLAEYIPDGKLGLPAIPAYKTIYISGGKKDKLNKVDIVGFFSQKGKLEKQDLGLIEVKDFISFAAVRTDKIPAFLAAIREEKMKGKKYKIEVAR